jgi:hypothetical protein
MSDEIIKELWEIKDDIAVEHAYHLESLVNYIQNKERPNTQRIVNLGELKKHAVQIDSTERSK